MNQEIGIILASHGKFADEALNSLEMIVGSQSNILSLALMPGSNLSDFTKEMEEAYLQLKNQKGVLIICDILGGTPSNAAASLLVKYSQESILAYSGLNLPILLEVTTNRTKSLIETESLIDEFSNLSWVKLNNKNKIKKVEGDL